MKISTTMKVIASSILGVLELVFIILFYLETLPTVAFWILTSFVILAIISLFVLPYLLKEREQVISSEEERAQVAKAYEIAYNYLLFNINIQPENMESEAPQQMIYVGKPSSLIGVFAFRNFWNKKESWYVAVDCSKNYKVSVLKFDDTKDKKEYKDQKVKAMIEGMAEHKVPVVVRKEKSTRPDIGTVYEVEETKEEQEKKEEAKKEEG